MAATPPTPTEPTPARPPRWPAWAFGLATLALMVATEPMLAIAWDEGYTLGREARIRAWFRGMADPAGFARAWTPPAPGTELVQYRGEVAPTGPAVDSRAKLLSARSMAWFWPFAREEPHGHPPFYAIVGLLGDLLTPGRPDLARARLGPIVAFSLAAGAIVAGVGRRFGAGAGLVAGLAWVLQPNLFGHGHYATLDGLLASLWAGALLAFARAVEPIDGRRNPRWAWALGFGVLCGWAADTKLTGWFLPVPFGFWAIRYRDRRGTLALLAGGAAGLIALFAFNPCWWNDPVGGVERFFRSNLNRGTSIPISTLFLGRVYQTPNGSLPWYNTLAWTALVTPAGLLGLALAGAWAAVRGRAGRFGSLALIQWGFLLLLRSLPHTPGHDGVRQFLPAFGMLAILAGIGARGVIGRWGRWGRLAVGAAVAEAGIGLALMMPVPLSYFSPLVGGLPGAARLGMEPTYFWDALDGRAIDWLNRNTPPGDSARFASYPTTWLYLARTGQLRAKLWRPGLAPPAWYVMQNRPGVFGPDDLRAIASGPPAYTVEKWGVPLILIYPHPRAGGR